MNAYVDHHGVGPSILVAGLTVAVRPGCAGLAGAALRSLALLCGVPLVLLIVRGCPRSGSTTGAPATPYRGDGLALTRLC